MVSHYPYLLGLTDAHGFSVSGSDMFLLFSSASNGMCCHCISLHHHAPVFYSLAVPQGVAPFSDVWGALVYRKGRSAYSSHS